MKRHIPLILLLLMSVFTSAFADVSLAPGRGVIYGYEFNDLNGNGIDNNEPRLPGFGVTLQGITSPSITMNTTTNAQGEFAFTELPRGTYDVCVVAPVVTPVWLPTTQTCRRVTLRGKTERILVRFGHIRDTNGGTTGGSSTGGTETGGSSTGGTETGGSSTGGTETGGSTTGGGDLGCTRTQGYWGSSPAGQARLIQLVGPGISLGNRTYSATELDDILDEPVGGGPGANRLIALAHQLIAAKVNVLNGADDSEIADDIAAAESLIGNLVIPPVGSDSVTSSSTLGQQMNAVASTLDDFNNGELNVPSCDD